MKSNCFAILLLMLASCNTAPKTNTTTTGNTFIPAGKKVFVYTTADSTNLRIAATDTLQFKDLPQPVETQVCVFVDPDKAFQPFLGIGGAITDAAAEVFAKLPKDKSKIDKYKKIKKLFEECEKDQD